MPTRKPHQQRKRRRPGAYVDAPVSPSGAGGTLRPETSAAAYTWPCPRCDCRRNLRGLLREICSNCTHVHHPPAEKETV